MLSMTAPKIETVTAATWKAFKGKLNDDEIQSFLDATSASSSPGTITATGSLYFFAIYGVVSCTPGKYPYHFEESAWGIGGTALSAGGVIYTAYDSWDDFFNLTTGYHAQGYTEGGGIFQINFFHKLTPIGQFNAVAGGIGAFECGGNGKWQPK